MLESDACMVLAIVRRTDVSLTSRYSTCASGRCHRLGCGRYGKLGRLGGRRFCQAEVEQAVDICSITRPFGPVGTTRERSASFFSASLRARKGRLERRYVNRFFARGHAFGCRSLCRCSILRRGQPFPLLRFFLLLVPERRQQAPGCPRQARQLHRRAAEPERRRLLPPISQAVCPGLSRLLQRMTCRFS